MMKFRKFVPSTIVQFLLIYLAALLCFSAFRVLLFITESGRIDHTTQGQDIFLAFIMGLRFDIVISGSILVLPFIIFTISSFFKTNHPIIKKLIHYFISILFSLAFLICAIDIPYFNQFFSRLSVTAFGWLHSPLFVFKMIVQEPRYWWVSIPLILFIILFIRITKKIIYHIQDTGNSNLYINIMLSIFFLGCMMIGIRGRLDKKSPIKVGTAYFSNNAFLNQLGLNPSYTLIKSLLDTYNDENKTIHLMDENQAITNVQQYLNIKTPDKSFPLWREVKFDTANPVKYNVVLVVMESMSAAKMSRNGNKDHLTPFLDTLANHSYYFENAYSAGIHTKNGLFSTFFSFPALFRQDPMKESAMLKYHGIFSTLKSHGYATIYFTTHDGQFDNVEGFLKENDCEKVITQSDYPSEKVVSTLGVPDDYMFEYSIPVLNQLHQKNQPFMAAFMTASDHGPYYIPDYFKPRNSELRKQSVEYADYSLQKFINLASKQAWFGNTIFVFIADHGAPIYGLYDMPLDYNHVPLIFYAPQLFKEPKVCKNFAGQIDVFPTIMGLLKQNYTNNTLGIDLFREKRPYMYFNADDKYGVIDDEWFLVVRDDSTKSLYKYRDADTYNYAGDGKSIVDKMNLYGKSNLQTFQYILNGNKQ